MQRQKTPTLVLVHGLLSSPREFALISKRLEAQGIDLHLLEVPGYTAGRLAERADWTRWLRAAGEALDARFAPSAPIVLGGLCVGASLALALAHEPRQQDICGHVLLSPTFAYDGWGLPWTRHLRHLVYRLGLDDWFSVPETEPFGIKNPKLRRWILGELRADKHSAVGPARLPLRAIHESERLHRVAQLHLTTSHAPTLVLHARDDEITSLASVSRWVAKTSGVSLVVLEDSYHMVTLDNDRHRVADELGRFVSQVRPCIETTRATGVVSKRDRSSSPMAA